jgi:hypothetical protein
VRVQPGILSTATKEKTSRSRFRCALNGMLLFSGNIRNAQRFLGDGQGQIRVLQRPESRDSSELLELWSTSLGQSEELDIHV